MSDDLFKIGGTFIRELDQQVYIEKLKENLEKVTQEIGELKLSVVRLEAQMKVLIDLKEKSFFGRFFR